MAINRYAELDQMLRNAHVVLYVASDDSDVTNAAMDEAAISAEMKKISEHDHAQVEAYRTAMGWKPCWKCQRAEGQK